MKRVEMAIVGLFLAGCRSEDAAAPVVQVVDPDVRLLLLPAQPSASGIPQPFHDALHRLHKRAGRPLVGPGDQPVLAGWARWAGSERVVVAIPHWPYGGSLMRLIDRTGTLTREVLWFATFDERARTGIRERGAELEVFWSDDLPPLAEPSVTLLVSSSGGQRRFRLEGPTPKQGQSIARVAVREDRLEILEFGPGLEELPPKKP